MLYPYNTITEQPIPAPWQDAQDEPVDLWIELVCGIDKLFSETHELLYAEGGKSLVLLWRDTVYLWQDLAEPFGAALAAIQKQWPLTLYGTSEARETVSVTFAGTENAPTACLSSVSGKPFDHLQGLGIQLRVEDADTAARLAALSEALSPRAGCAALARRDEAFVRSSTLLAEPPGSFFLYIAWQPGQNSADYLHCLSIPQKAALWRVFLQDELQPSEFDWLWTLYSAGEAPALLEWELALRAVLEDLNFQIERQERHFTVTDGSGKVRWFDFLKGGPAEKLFLKLLFPLNIRGV